MLRRLRQESGAGTVCRLPVSSAVAEKVIGSGNTNRRDDEEKKNEHVFFSRTEDQREREGNAFNVVRPAVFAN